MDVTPLGGTRLTGESGKSLFSHRFFTFTRFNGGSAMWLPERGVGSLVSTSRHKPPHAVGTVVGAGRGMAGCLFDYAALPVSPR
jgi:hypothetical protein